MILALGLVWLVIVAYPGVMTMDSFDQLREGREWFFTDSHPPIMAALWGILDRIIAGPITMLVLQGTAFLVGLYLILKHVMTPRRAAVSACVLLAFPPIFAPLLVIWKDCLMAGSLVLGIAAMLDGRRWVRVLGLVAFMLATALRYNAPAATLPLIVLLFEWQPGKRWLARYSIAAATWLAVTVCAFGINALLTDKQMHFWQQSIALGDIVGTLQFVEPTLSDAELRPLLGPTEILVDHDIHARVRAKYKSNDFQQLLTGEGHLWDVPWSEPMPQIRAAAVSHAWWTLLRDHPGAFLRYRLENFGETLGVNRQFAGGMVVAHRVQYVGMLDYMGIGRGSSKLQSFVEDKYLWLARRTRLFRPHVYALLALGLLGLCRRDRMAFALLLSGLFMELTLFVLGGTPDYRYSHWLVVTACLGIIVLFARRRHQTISPSRST
ncbi:MAG TPA: hypothetical protein VIV40_27475 [Kofleriaceae bacterium]